jgi:Holliday junction resolvasome RuvABC endonuclease subunit
MPLQEYPDMHGCGVDQSLSSTGYAFKANGRLVYNTIKTTNIDSLIVRHRATVGQLMILAAKHEFKWIAMEDYAYGTFGKQPKIAAKLCELGGQIKYRMNEQNIIVYVINTNYVKQWIGLTNRNNKSAMVKQYNEMYNKTFRMKDNDIVDALILHEIGQICYFRQMGNAFPNEVSLHRRGLVDAILLGGDTVLMPAGT